jgi:hypothetical protein
MFCEMGISWLPLVGDVAALVAALVLLALGVLHALWAAGLPWPLSSRSELALTVVGDAKRHMPSRFLTLVVAGLLVFAAIWALGLRGILMPKPPVGALSGLVTWGMVGVFALRGILGFFEAALRPSIIGTPYQRWSLRLYSPLSVVLATAIGLAAV